MGISHVFNGGPVPENELPRVAELEPHLIIFVDAVHFGGGAGELRMLAPEDMREDDVSTHTASLSALAEFLQMACGAGVLVLAVQPTRREMGCGLSPRVQEAACQAVRCLAAVLSGNTS
jgi:hydrogenase 3 maturation protease